MVTSRIGQSAGRRIFSLCLLVLLFLPGCGGGKGENSPSPTPSINSPNIPPSTLSLCQMKEEMVGIWEQDSLRLGDAILSDLGYQFGPFGEFWAIGKETETGFIATLSGRYEVFKEGRIALNYEAVVQTEWGDLLGSENTSEEGQFGFSGDDLLLQFPNEPLYLLQPLGDSTEPVDDSWYPWGNPFRSDGLCVPEDLGTLEWEKEPPCGKERLAGDWFLVFPIDDPDQKSSLDGMTFRPVDEASGELTWHYWGNPVPGSEEEAEDETEEKKGNKIRIKPYDHKALVAKLQVGDTTHVSGEYLWTGPDTIKLSFFANDPQKHTLRFSGNYLSLQGMDGKEILLSKAAPADLDQDLFLDGQKLDDRDQDAVCEGEFLDSCPAKNLIGAWVPAPYYQKLYQDADIALDWDLSLLPFERLLFYDSFDGKKAIARVYRNGRLEEKFYYQVGPCATCSTGAGWLLGLATDFQAFSEGATGLHSTIEMDLSEGEMVLYLPGDEGEKVGSKVLVLTKLAVFSSKKPLNCTESLNDFHL